METVVVSVVDSFKIYCNQVLLVKIAEGLKKNHNLEIKVEELASYCELGSIDGRNIVMPEEFNKKVAVGAKLKKAEKSTETATGAAEANGNKCKYSTNRMPKCDADAVQDGYCKRHRNTDGVKKLLAKQESAAKKEMNGTVDSESDDDQKKTKKTKETKEEKKEPGVKQVQVTANKMEDGRYMLEPFNFVAEQVDGIYMVAGKKDDLTCKIRDLDEDEVKIVGTMGGLKVAEKKEEKKEEKVVEKKEEKVEEKKEEKKPDTDSDSEKVVKKITRRPRGDSKEKKEEEKVAEKKEEKKVEEKVVEKKEEKVEKVEEKVVEKKEEEKKEEEKEKIEEKKDSGEKEKKARLVRRKQ